MTEMPAFAPMARMESSVCIIRSGVSASRWTVRKSAPALQKASAYRPGSVIIKCTSRVRSDTRRRAFTTGMPMVMFGTKCPSIIST